MVPNANGGGIVGDISIEILGDSDDIIDCNDCNKCHR